ncbi:MAG: hypothetical protein B6D61_05435 [Bacteroidetes bacterium 4484_249]|nr:MAG: hypothetical protein B6D61_05435 [Bacteroidetes bacterium 4484_249]
MDLIFVTNARFSKTSDGKIYGHFTSLTSGSFKHYLKVFDKIRVIARIEESQSNTFGNTEPINNKNVEILGVPYFLGPYQFLTQKRKIKKKLKDYLNKDAAVICRIPGALGHMAANILSKEKRLYAVEVAGDPIDVFAPGTFKHPFRFFFKYYGYFRLKKGVQNAIAALYVTERALQKRYPVKKGVYSTNASNVIIDQDFIVPKAKKLTTKNNYSIISVGTLDQMYKGPDVLLKAIKILITRGYNVNLIWLGDGKYKKDMEYLAKKLMIDKHVKFAGIIKPAAKVINYLDNSDLFVLPSRTEGLPRALIEAMARGLPCISTNIGGIPELLSENSLVPINDSKVLARRIEIFLKDLPMTNQLAEENLEKVKNYSYDILNKRRRLFYQYIKNNTKQFNTIQNK